MKIVFIGAVEFSKKMLELLIAQKVDIAGVITKENLGINADFANLRLLCETNNIPCKVVGDINRPDNIEWISNINPDIIFCFGWSYLLKKEVLKIPPMGVVGYHPAALPQNRGRHPIVWALSLGLEKTASTFFFIDDGADTGDILSQREIGIAYHDNARTLYDKLLSVASEQIVEFLPKLESKIFTRTPQDHSKANYWRKRTNKDGEIDFRMTSLAIYNLVRALTIPYVGAHVVRKGREIKIWKAAEMDLNLPNIEHGKVLEVKNGQILVKCYDNAINLIEHEFEELPQTGEYL